MIPFGVLAGSAAMTLFRFLTGWPRPVGVEDAVGLALGILVVFPLVIWSERRRYAETKRITDEIRELIR